MTQTDSAVQNAMRSLPSGSSSNAPTRMPRMSGLSGLYNTKQMFASTIDLNTIVYDPMPAGAQKALKKLADSQAAYQWENWMRWGLIGLVEKLTGKKVATSGLTLLAQARGAFNPSMVMFTDGSTI